MTSSLDPQLALSILDQSPCGALVTDGGEIIWTNRTLSTMLGLSRLDGLKVDNLSEQGLNWLVEPGDDHRVTDAKGKRRWIRTSQASLAAGQAVWFYEDITEIKTLQLEQDREQYANDGLTGLLNRRAIMQILEPQVSRSRRYHNSLTVMLMKIKPLLEEAGRTSPVSDDLLQKVGQHLKDQMRWADQIGRYDEDTFIMVLPETQHADANKLRDKLTKSMQALNDLHDINRERIRAIFGISQWSKSDDAQSLIQRALEELDQNQH